MAIFSAPARTRRATSRHLAIALVNARQRPRSAEKAKTRPKPGLSRSESTEPPELGSRLGQLLDGGLDAGAERRERLVGDLDAHLRKLGGALDQPLEARLCELAVHLDHILEGLGSEQGGGRGGGALEGGAGIAQHFLADRLEALGQGGIALHDRSEIVAAEIGQLLEVRDIMVKAVEGR